MRVIIEKRQAVSQSARILVPLISFVLSLVFGAFLLFLSGVDPLATYAAMAKGAPIRPTYSALPMASGSIASVVVIAVMRIGRTRP